MLTKEAVAALAPFKHALSKNSFNTLHRCLELTSDYVQCRTSYVALDISVSLGKFEKPIHVDGMTFLAVLDSLPDDKELHLAHRDNALHWSCGTTKGKMAVIDMPDLEHIDHRFDSTDQPSAAFITALELGSLSCDQTTMASVGMSGVLIDTQIRFVASTDDVTLSTCFYKNQILDTHIPDFVALSAETIPLLINTMTEIGYMEITDNTIKYADEGRFLIVSQVSPLSRQSNLISLIAKCNNGQISVPIPRDTIQTFLKRAAALTVSRPQLSVTIGIEINRITLEFDEATAQTQDYFLIDKDITIEGVRLRVNAAKFARALKYVDEMVFDYMSDHILVLRSKSHDFMYIIGGR